MKNHVEENHKRLRKCTKCDSQFVKMNELELHIQNVHQEEEKFKCTQCKNEFFTKWRLAKHAKMHQTNVKKCHFFNNNKECPYEKLGCMFEHTKSQKCKFEETCTRKLCQYVHSKLPSKSVDSESVSDVAVLDILPMANEKENETDKNNVSSDAFSLEEYEARDIYCDNYCSKEKNIHTHTSFTYKPYRGVSDIESISNIICELCEHASTNIKEHEKHYDMEHHGEECTVSCVFPKCDFSSNCPEELIEHFKVVHDRWIQKTIKKKFLGLITG